MHWLKRQVTIRRNLLASLVVDLKITKQQRDFALVNLSKYWCIFCCSEQRPRVSMLYYITHHRDTNRDRDRTRHITELYYQTYLTITVLSVIQELEILGVKYTMLRPKLQLDCSAIKTSVNLNNQSEARQLQKKNMLLWLMCKRTSKTICSSFNSAKGLRHTRQEILTHSSRKEVSLYRQPPTKLVFNQPLSM